MFDYQRNNNFFAQVPGKMEELCLEELRELGASNLRVAYRGVYFQAEQPELYKINYTSRLLTRVLAPLFTFNCKSTNDIKNSSTKTKWEKLISLNTTFAITASVSNSNITHSKYAALCLKDSIADHFNAKYKKRPNVDPKNPDVRINLHIEKEKATVSLDLSGESLHKRGYRLLAGDAPMQETLAAALVRISEWKGENQLWDCMCGSGTIICEALMKYCNIPAQYLREKFGFFNLPDFNKSLWEQIKSECDKNILPLPKGLISGSDSSPKAIEIARENIGRLPYSENVNLFIKQFQKADSFENGTIITNPPYGIRLGQKQEAELLFKELGDFLKQNCSGTSAFIYTGDPALRKSIGLKTSRRIHLVNGKLEGVLFRIDSFKGTHKDQKADKTKT
jgi:putative N6-adenine-specific DNA methylase